MAQPVSVCGAVQGANQVLNCFPPSQQNLLVPALIGLAANLAGVNVDCPTLAGLAQQYACIPPAQQLPALLYLFVQIVNNTAASGGGGVGPQGPPGPPGQPGAPGQVQVFNTVGAPAFNPGTSIALALDDTSNPGVVSAWLWSSNAWTQFLG